MQNTKQKVIISVLGLDRPGILANISKSLFEQDCNIENVSQTILQTIFGAILIGSKPTSLTEKELEKRLQESAAKLSLDISVKPFIPEKAPFDPAASQPFIITTVGPDRKGLVAGITDVLSRQGCNITNLKAAFKGGDDPMNNMMIYEVDVPNSVDLAVFYSSIKNKASELGIEVNIQHRRLFEAINRI